MIRLPEGLAVPDVPGTPNAPVRAELRDNYGVEVSVTCACEAVFCHALVRTMLNFLLSWTWDRQRLGVFLEALEISCGYRTPATTAQQMSKNCGTRCWTFVIGSNQGRQLCTRKSLNMQTPRYPRNLAFSRPLHALYIWLCASRHFVQPWRNGEKGKGQQAVVTQGTGGASHVIEWRRRGANRKDVESEKGTLQRDKSQRNTLRRAKGKSQRANGKAHWIKRKRAKHKGAHHKGNGQPAKRKAQSTMNKEHRAKSKRAKRKGPTANHKGTQHNTEEHITKGQRAKGKGQLTMAHVGRGLKKTARSLVVT